MGYVHSKLAQFIHPADFDMSAGTWAMAISSNVISYNRTAHDSALTMMVPIRMPSSDGSLKGAKLTAITVAYQIGTAAADDFSEADLYKLTLSPNDTAPTGAAVSTTKDDNHNLSAKRKTVGYHTMTITIDSPAFIDDYDSFMLKLVVDCAATTVLKVFGAVAHFTLRA